MPLNNPFAAPDFDMQDIRGDHYGVFDPALTILRGEGLAYLVLACALYWQIALIWFAHIGFDRALGYGLKYPLGFRVTHLGVLKGMAIKE